MKTLLLLFAVLLILVSCTKNDKPTEYQNTVLTPTINPVGGLFYSEQDIALTCSTAGAQIRYTLDGSEPAIESLLYSGPIHVDSTLTIKARAFKDNWIPSAIASQSYQFQVGELFIIPMGGSFTAPQTVRITPVTDGSVIHYTTDGTEPSISSPVYLAPIIIDGNTNLKAKANIEGWTESSTVSVNFTFQVTNPVFSVNPGTFSSPVNLSLSCPTDGSEIRYTTDGTEPSETSSLYISPLNISVNTQVKARAYKSGWSPSSQISGWYYLQVVSPVFSPVQGSFYSNVNVSISCSTPGTTIYYTTNGSAPTTFSAVYSAPVAIAMTTILKAIAVKANWVNSNVATGNYNFQIYAPQFSIPGGQYSGTQTISITCATPGVQIRYTTDNYTPNATSTLYSGPLSISSNTILKAKAFKQNFFDSPETAATYLFVNNVATPVFSPTPGEYNEPTNVTISCATSGATIRYTFDNTEPGSQSSIYSSPLLLNSNTTIKAKAYYSNWVPSQTVTADYDIYVPMEMIHIPAGFFTMGDTHGYGYIGSSPTHMVSLSAYDISNFEITQQEWMKVMGYNPSTNTGNLHKPVEQVSMFACMVYCNKKSILEGLTPVYSVNNETNPDIWGPIPTIDSPNYNAWRVAVCNWSANGYRLPTEAEWEYAARSATINPDYLYSGGNTLSYLGWYASNSTLQTHPVGQKQANALGLYDMSGNVEEWCWDWYDQNYYAGSPTDNPTGPPLEAGLQDRAIRGGSYLDVMTMCAVCARASNPIVGGLSYIGFRIARSNP